MTTATTTSPTTTETSTILRRDMRWQNATGGDVDVPAGTVVELVDEPGVTKTVMGWEYVEITVPGVDGLAGSIRLVRPDGLDEVEL